MTNGAGDLLHANQRLSALADGEIDAAELRSVIDDWQARPDARRAWHDYHLIGDVLRSDDLAEAAPGDAAFLAAVRRRMASEPTVLAPAASPLAAAARREPAGDSRRMMASYAAMAAGLLVVVAGVVTMVGLPFTSGTSADSIAQRSAERTVASADAARLAREGAGDPLQQVEATVASGQLIRDAGLDRYLAAHHQWSGSAKLGGHAVYLQSPPDNTPGR